MAGQEGPMVPTPAPTSTPTSTPALDSSASAGSGAAPDSAAARLDGGAPDPQRAGRPAGSAPTSGPPADPRSGRDPAPEREPRRARPTRHALLVIGMHRSGTSAVTRVLSLCGARLPEHLMPAGERNPRGYFESQRIYELHEQLLAEAGSAWDDLAPFPPGWLDSPAAPVWIDRMADAVRKEFGGAPIVTLKDPRIGRLIPFWQRVLDAVEYAPAFVIPVRNPLDVAASLARAEGIPEAKGLLLWLEHLLAVERDTRGMPRTFVAYDALLKDWRSAVAKIADDLDIVFPRTTPRAAAEIDDFLAAELRHHATPGDEVASRRSVPPWVRIAYDSAMRAAAGEQVATDVLDRLEAEVRPAEIAFAPVVAAIEVARDQAREEAERLEHRARRLASDVERLGAELAQTRDEATRARQLLGDRERQTGEIVDWLKLLLAWAMRAVHGEEATAEHLESVLAVADKVDAGAMPQVAALGLRLAQQSAEAARLAEEADVHAAEAQRLRQEVTALRGEVARREQEGVELAALKRDASGKDAELQRLAREAERATQQVRGLWQQIAARDGEFARMRQQVAEAERLAAEVGDLRRETAGRADAFARLQDQVRDAAAGVAERDLCIETLRAQLDTVERSRLWRALRPFSRLAADIGAIFRR